MRAERSGRHTRKVADLCGYETLLKQSKAVDFDDLLLRSRGCAEVRRFERSGGTGLRICTSMSIRTRTACSIAAADADERAAECLRGGDEDSRSTAGAGRMFRFC